MPWTYVISDLKNEDVVGMFYIKELQKISQEEFRVEKVIEKKMINYMLNVKDLKNAKKGFKKCNRC